MMIELIFPTKEYRDQIAEYAKKFADENTNIPGVGIHGAGDLAKLDVDTWLQQCVDYKKGRSLPDGFVPATQFLAVRKNDNKLVGMIAIRHSLTPHLLEIGGHVGYSVAPDERGKGYATQMLRLGLVECKKLGIERVRVTCKTTNQASESVIKKCGGEFDGTAEYEGLTFNRYWITI